MRVDNVQDYAQKSFIGGSVRKAGNGVRVTAQLIDVATGHHIWVKRYDRNPV